MRLRIKLIQCIPCHALQCKIPPSALNRTWFLLLQTNLRWFRRIWSRLSAPVRLNKWFLLPYQFIRHNDDDNDNDNNNNGDNNQLIQYWRYIAMPSRIWNNSKLANPNKLLKLKFPMNTQLFNWFLKRLVITMHLFVFLHGWYLDKLRCCPARIFSYCPSLGPFTFC